jgi:hypothetical protein
MIRNNLLELEQKINARTQFTYWEQAGTQQHVTRCCGSLTTLNLLFKERADSFGGR